MIDSPKKATSPRTLKPKSATWRRLRNSKVLKAFWNFLKQCSSNAQSAEICFMKNMTLKQRKRRQTVPCQATSPDMTLAEAAPKNWSARAHVIRRTITITLLDQLQIATGNAMRSHAASGPITPGAVRVMRLQKAMDPTRHHDRASMFRFLYGWALCLLPVYKCFLYTKIEIIINFDHVEMNNLIAQCSNIDKNQLRATTFWYTAS